MYVERLDEHDVFFIPKTESEKVLWENLRQSAKIQIKTILTGRENGKKGGRPPKKIETPIDKELPLTKKTPTLEEVLEYAQQQNNFAGVGGFVCTPEQAEEFWSYYESQGWRIGNDSNTPIKDWQPKLRQWCIKAKQTFKQTQKPATILHLSARERQDLINKQKTEILLQQLKNQGN